MSAARALSRRTDARVPETPKAPSGLIRARAKAALAAPVGGTPRRETVLATLVRLLDTTLVRIGNDEYARIDRSYDLTTSCSRHADVKREPPLAPLRGKSEIERLLVFIGPA